MRTSLPFLGLVLAGASLLFAQEAAIPEAAPSIPEAAPHATSAAAAVQTERPPTAESNEASVGDELAPNFNSASDAAVPSVGNEEGDKSSPGPVTVFHLKNANASNAARILDDLYRTEDILLTIDEATNAILVRSDEEMISAIREVLAVIDVAERREQWNAPKSIELNIPALQSSDSALADPKIFSFYYGFTGKSVAELRKRDQAVEQQAQELAAKLRAGGSNAESPAEVTDQLRAELREKVRQSFMARQSLQRAEVAQFAQRLEHIRQTIEDRDHLADQIIDRRVDDLLNPNLQWESGPVDTGSAARPAAGSTAPTSATGTGSRPSSLERAEQNRSWPAEARIELKEPKAARIQWLRGDGNFMAGGSRLVFNVPLSQSIMFRMNEIPGRENSSIFVSIEAPQVNGRTVAFVTHNAIPLSITDEDLDQVASGNAITKVLYFPQNLTIDDELVQTVASNRLAPGLDPLVEAWGRGSILAIVRLSKRENR